MDQYQYNKEELTELVQNRKYTQLAEELTHINEVDAADFISSLDTNTQKMVVFGLLEKDVAADVFANMDRDSQQALISSLNDQQLSTIIEDLATDDAVDMIGELPANIVRKILRIAKPDTRSLINTYLRYPEDSVGSIMTAEFVDLKKTMTVKEAISRIRAVGEDKETIYTCYVTDEKHHLEGIVTIRDLLLAKDDAVVDSLMEKDVISVTTLDDQEKAALLFRKYDFLSMPVVDKENRLVGIVTVDDAVDVMSDEATEDFEKMAAMQPSEKPYLKTGVFELARNRIVWLLVLMISGMVSGSILSHYESAFVLIPILVSFVPMLTDTGGNAGSQASTMIIRGLALGELTPHDWFRIVWKEIRVAVICGTILATVNFARIMLTYRNVQVTVALTVSLTMVCTVCMAKVLGATLPIVAKKLHLDPALMASPMLTTIVDALTLIIYFTVAKELLGI
ncbi:MAG: magnesium transporter [Sphaerochaetaceae bacterium]|jgi:magnesium transporter|nr:magnesium transporter [Sphaerochaetaceae bacterium]